MKETTNNNSEMPPDNEAFQILAIDGGGFRGLFAAHCLAMWEETSGQRAADCFDLITGTSTGGIIALGLGLGLPARELVNFYLEDGKQIFPSSWITRQLRGLRQLVLPKFSSKPLQQALQARLGDKKLLGDSRTRLVIPAFDMSTHKPCYFKTDHHKNYKIDWARHAWEVAMATSAAPTFFPPYQSSWASTYVDGGIWANNPANIGVIEAVDMLGVNPKAIRILNLGTGAPGIGVGKPSWMYQLGILGWATKITDILLDANALAISGMMERIYRENYIRVSPALNNGQLPLDSYAPQQILSLAEERARFSAGAADVFFKHYAAPYAKTRSENSVCNRIEVCA